MMSAKILPHKQQGATLIIALVFMVLLTVISLSSMHSSSFEVKVARSVKSQVDALTVAEEALAAGEAAVASITDISNFPTTSGFYQGASLASVSDLSTLLTTFTGSTAATSVSGSNGFFHVEYLGTPPVAGNSGAFGAPGITIQHLFRVTGIGVLPGGRYKVVQSYYATSE